MARFTAQEIRDAVQKSICEDNIAEMLLQYADELDREKRYEYSIKNPNGNIMKCHEDEMFPVMPLICKVVRREVGEWEEVVER